MRMRVLYLACITAFHPGGRVRRAVVREAAEGDANGGAGGDATHATQQEVVREEQLPELPVGLFLKSLSAGERKDTPRATALTFDAIAAAERQRN